MRLIVVGSGGATRDLLAHLGRRWDVVVIDLNPERLFAAATVRSIEAIQGDGSSRVTLDRARIGEADGVVAATSNDEVNLEVCRLAREFGVFRIAALSADPERLPEYRAVGVDVFAPDRLAARTIEAQLEPSRVSTVSFAAGKAQAIEMRLASTSPAVGRPLRSMSAERWLVASILRRGRLIVPHGSTVLQADDLVTVIGAATDYPLILRSFTAGGTRFPLSYGRTVVVALESERDIESVVGEAANLTRNSAAEALLVLHREGRDAAEEDQAEALASAVIEAAEGVEVRTSAVQGAPSRAWGALPASASAGVAVIPAPKRGGFLAERKLGRAVGRLRRGGVPALFARGHGGYEKIVVVALGNHIVGRVVEAAIDLATAGRTPLVGLGVVPAGVLPASAEYESVLRALARLREEAALAGLRVRRRIRKGHPAGSIIEIAGNGLVVMAFPERVVRGGPAIRVIRDGDCSVLLIP